MKTLKLNQMLKIEAGSDANCDGIYYSCIGAAALAGAAGVAATGGLAVYLAVAASGMAMEYCRQQAIGCQG
ncbi:hypothetical protein [Pontibacter mangrovi]|uniref:Bacteriocin n=1 Tax=Pontibacter mangrovi TaxID=2589816 RepID=A0A501VPY4_9BACT|nr:hypothetical protein [Pontibacter mangrovi]TPE39729.1 hypothetical protein FJM65_20815 [Pontibacter mangrovi]